MSSFWGTICAFVVGAIGWFCASFIARPLRAFFDLRGEVIRQSALYDNVPAFLKEFADGSVEQCELSEDEMKRLSEAQGVFRDLAARMRAFALNEHLASWLVKWRYDPWEASFALLWVSNNLHKYGIGQALAKQRLEKALAFSITDQARGASQPENLARRRLDASRRDSRDGAVAARRRR